MHANAATTSTATATIRIRPGTDLGRSLMGPLYTPWYAGANGCASSTEAEPISPQAQSFKPGLRRLWLTMLVARIGHHHLFARLGMPGRHAVENPGSGPGGAHEHVVALGRGNREHIYFHRGLEGVAIRVRHVERMASQPDGVSVFRAGVDQPEANPLTPLDHHWFGRGVGLAVDRHGVVGGGVRAAAHHGAHAAPPPHAAHHLAATLTHPTHHSAHAAARPCRARVCLRQRPT